MLFGKHRRGVKSGLASAGRQAQRVSIFIDFFYLSKQGLTMTEFIVTVCLTHIDTVSTMCLGLGNNIIILHNGFALILTAFSSQREEFPEAE